MECRIMNRQESLEKDERRLSYQRPIPKEGEEHNKKGRYEKVLGISPLLIFKICFLLVNIFLPQFFLDKICLTSTNAWRPCVPNSSSLSRLSPIGCMNAD
ncbi:hypothetical protein TWF173_007888 [Orbilia oligospora]|uniref:Transmembrane protein n=1 Tax=Orbilia oligospora TaxID=2813651 RepID=A0A7C8RC72_ORBOL|nr:hypothetical protein TWF970_005173 [Orbilia oligospora]KAF3318481.1 hypothetical protein TWF173_007888 [Orbilia oligospora]